MHILRTVLKTSQLKYTLKEMSNAPIFIVKSYG